MGRLSGRRPDQGYLLQGTTSDRVVRFRDVPDPQMQLPSYWNARGDRVFVPSGGLRATPGSCSAWTAHRGRRPRGRPARCPTAGWATTLVALAPSKAAGSGTRFAVQTWRAGAGWATTGHRSITGCRSIPRPRDSTSSPRASPPTGPGWPSSSGPTRRTRRFPRYRVRPAQRCAGPRPWSRAPTPAVDGQTSGASRFRYADNSARWPGVRACPLTQLPGDQPRGRDGAGPGPGPLVALRQSEPLTVTEGRLGVQLHAVGRLGSRRHVPRGRCSAPRRAG